MTARRIRLGLSICGHGYQPAWQGEWQKRIVVISGHGRFCPGTGFGDAGVNLPLPKAPNKTPKGTPGLPTIQTPGDAGWFCEAHADNGEGEGGHERP